MEQVPESQSPEVPTSAPDPTPEPAPAPEPETVEDPSELPADGDAVVEGLEEEVPPSEGS